MELSVLRTSILFQGMKDDCILTALKCLKATKSFYRKGSWILTAGEPIREVGILTAGTANSIVETNSGNRSLIEKLLPCDIFGESIVLSGIICSNSSIIAMEDCDIVTINMDNIKNKNYTSCGFRTIIVENLLQLSANHCISLNQKMDILSHKGIRQRVFSYLKQEMSRCHKCEFCINLSRSELAEYLQLDRSALSRELGRMQEERIIDYRGSFFRILKSEL